MAEKDSPLQETEIELGGKTYHVRPTFKVITSIEASLNQPVRTLGFKCWVYAQAFNDRGPNAVEISVTEMAAILFQMVREQEDAPKSAMEVGELLMEEGYGQHCMVVGDFLLRAQKGNREHQKDAERRAKRETTSPPAKGSVSKAA
jgi:hypothetical protein